MIGKMTFRVLFAVGLGTALLGRPSFAGFASTETYLPSVGRIPGKFGAQFYSTVWATNLTSAPQTFTFRFLKAGQSNPSPPSFDDTLQPGETKVYENVVESKLGLTNVLGAARITSSGEIFFAERIYNQQPGDDLGKTEGLFFAGVPKSFSISAGQSATIQGIDQGGAENFRYNFALIETGGGSANVNVQILDGNGTLLGQRSFPLSPYEQLQPNVADVVASIATTNARIAATVTDGDGSVLLAGAQLANESQDSSGFEMTFRDELLGGGGVAGVTSLNGLTGALTIAHGANTTVNVNGQTITIDAVSGSGTGLTAVAHDNSLAGSGTVAVPLAIANGQVVRSLNGLHDAVMLAAGSNVSITPSGSTLTIASAGTTLPITSTLSDPKTVIDVTNSGSGGGVAGEAGNNFGIFGYSQTFHGVEGHSDSDIAVYGETQGDTAAGVQGRNNPNGNDGFLGGQNYGVLGSSGNGNAVIGQTSSHTSAGVQGQNTNTGTAGYLGGQNYGVFSHGDIKSDGGKSFVEPHPTDPTKQIDYVCLEGRESGTYFRGTGRIVDGLATIDVPEDFRIVTSAKGLTVQLTPIGEMAVLAAVSRSLDRIVVQGSKDVEFDYMVNGVRKAFEDHRPVVENRFFVPRSKDDDFARALPEESVRRLVANGTLNPDGTVNLETAHRLGWDRQKSWERAAEPEGHVSSPR